MTKKRRLSRLIAQVRHTRGLARGSALALQVRVMGGHVGKRLVAGPGAWAGQAPHAGWHIGDDVFLGRGAILDVAPEGRLVLGDRVKVMHYTVVSAEQSITIGDDTQVAEHCSVRDQDHAIDVPGLIASAPLVTTPIAVGSNVWVGRGVAILRGARIGDGCVIGANSVVTSGELPADAVCVGAPASFLRARSTDESGPHAT